MKIKGGQDAVVEIVITEGKEYQNREDDVYQPDAFFYQSYHQAATCVEDILQVGRKYQMGHRNWEMQASDQKLDDWLRGYPSNVVAFCAERGQGKTSAMISFARALSQLGKETGQEKWRTEWNKHHNQEAVAPKYCFEVLNSIDPSYMQDQKSILDIFLSRLFRRFQDYWEQQNSGMDCFRGQQEQLTLQRTILHSFQICYRNLQARHKSEQYDDDALEQIMELGDSGNLRGSLYRLISAVLDFMYPKTDSYLVLQIDDADLSLGDTFQLIDQIRRNLVMPRVIILLAANIFQLESTVEQHFIRQYQQSIQMGGMVTVENCHNIAARYMDKVIPGARQIFLPDLGKLVAREFERICVRYESRQDNYTNLLDDEQEELRYQDQLLRYLYKRTGLVLLDPKTHLHNLLPGNMRELAHFFPYFRIMPQLTIGYEDLISYMIEEKAVDEQGIILWLDNLERLKRYLIDIWAPVNLRTEGHQFLRNLPRYGDANLHRYVLDFLPNYYASEQLQPAVAQVKVSSNKLNHRQQFIDQCTARGLQYYNPSGGCQYATYADVMEGLNVLGALPNAQRQYKFIYAVRLYYTIRLHQLMLEGIRDKYAGELPEFLGDVLWRRDDLQGRQAEIYFGHYEIDGQELSDILQRLYGGGGLNAQCVSIFSSFCRRPVREKSFYSVAAVNAKDLKAQEKMPLYFHMFYPCLHDLELLMGRSTPEDIKAIREQPEFRNRILGSMILLLNWDVQYALSRKYVNSIVSTDEKIETISGAIEGAYCSTAMQDIFTQIQRATGMVWNDNLFKYYRELLSSNKDLIEILYVIQYCHPELRQHLFRYCECAVKQIKKDICTLRKEMSHETRPLEQLDGLVFQGDIKDKECSRALRNVMQEIIRSESALKLLSTTQEGTQHSDIGMLQMNFSQLEECLDLYQDLLEHLGQDQTTQEQKQTTQVRPVEPSAGLNWENNLAQLVESLRDVFAHAAIVKIEPVQPKD